MLTSKQRAELRAQANTLEVTLIVGKEGVTSPVIQSAVILLESKELVKGKVLETAGLTAREASDAICEATGADGVQCVGSKFVIYRKSKKLEAQRAAQKAKERAAKKVNPVREGIRKRKEAARKERERKDEYFRKQREKERREKK
jgi:RNA-binding protein